MMDGTSGPSMGSRELPRTRWRLIGCCVLLLTSVMLVSIATSSSPTAVVFPNISKRGLEDSPARPRLPPALSSSSSSSSSQRSETSRRRGASPASKHHINPDRHGSTSITPTPSLGATDGGSGNLGDGAQGIHLLLRPPDLLTPSQVPHFHGNGPPTPAPPTLTTPEDLYPVQSAEVDWGSGDYLETLTFMGSEGEELSLVTTLPTHGYDPYDPEDDFDAGISYNTAFPSRPVPSLSSRLLLPDVTIGYGPTLRTAQPTDPRLPQGSDSAQSSDLDPDDFDWTELFPIEPTEMLLPDMNSLEYYNTLQAKENTSAMGNRTYMHTHPTRPHITPTATHTQPPSPAQTPTPSLGEGEGKAPGPTGWTGSKVGVPVTSPSPQKPGSRPAPTPPPTDPRLSGEPPSPPGKGAPHPAPPTPKGDRARPYPQPPQDTLQVPAIQAITLRPPFVSRPRATAKTTTTTTATTTTTTISTTTLSSKASLPTAPRMPFPGTPRQCNITKPDMYLVRVGMPSGLSVAFAKLHIREILKRDFNRSLDLQVLKAPPNFVFRAVSGPQVFTAMSIINALRQSARSSASSIILAVTPIYAVPDHKFHVHSVLQFVPSHVDVRVCSFSERVERGLFMAFAEARRRSQESGNFTVHDGDSAEASLQTLTSSGEQSNHSQNILNITISLPKGQRQQRTPVDVTFAVRDKQGFLDGSKVSAHLRQLSMVEYSFYLGFPAVQIAEPFHYPELNVSHLLRSSWVKTVLLGVQDQRVSDRTFQAKMERRLALLVGEGLGLGRRWKRATSVGNNSVQVVRASRLDGGDYPLELVYFVESGSGERLPGNATAAMLNRLNLQRAAIVLGYRVHGVLATPVEKPAEPPSETQPSNVWLIVGVVVPVLVVILIIIILCLKLCRSEKLEFQPDAMSTIQQRQKLQAPSVKGFDFAKLHLGQHSKDDIMVIQEPAALPPSVKEATPSEGGELNTPKSKSSSTKASRAARRRGRLSPSDGDSLGSEASSGRESAEESTRPAVTPSDSKPHHRKSKHAKNKLGAPSGSGADEQLSSSSIFEHVDRVSRGSSDGTRRVSNKIQLIAMQPMPSPLPSSHNHALSPALTERVPDGAKVNTEIQVALRHKSEIEHHRNKIRLRAKRKGHYDFPSMEDIMAVFGDGSEQQRVYQQAQEQIHKILHPNSSTPPPGGEPRKSSRSRRSPRQRQRQNMSSSLTDKDLLLTEGDATYRKYPGVNNVAYVSDPDQLHDTGSPSPTDEVFVDPGSPPPGPAPAPPAYVPPQPTIEEARQQMHSLLDDAFALVSPSSQGSSAPLTFASVAAVTGVEAVSPGPPSSSPPPRPVRQWGSSSYPAAPAHSPFSARYAELGMSPTSVQGLLQSQALGSGYLVSTELPTDPVYPSREQYGEELPSSSSRPRPVGGSTGAQLHQLTQVGLSSRIGVYPGVGRSVSGPSGSSWAQYRSDEELSRPGANREAILSFPEYTSSPVFQMPRTSLREPSTPPTHLDPPTPGYAPIEEPSAPPTQSSASLIKAIREELQRLSQKQPAVAAYHS